MAVSQFTEGDTEAQRGGLCSSRRTLGRGVLPAPHACCWCCVSLPASLSAIRNPGYRSFCHQLLLLSWGCHRAEKQHRAPVTFSGLALLSEDLPKSPLGPNSLDGLILVAFQHCSQAPELTLKHQEKNSWSHCPGRREREAYVPGDHPDSISPALACSGTWGQGVCMWVLCFVF